jgi:hypothetical protein
VDPGRRGPRVPRLQPVDLRLDRRAPAPARAAAHPARAQTRPQPTPHDGSQHRLDPRKHQHARHGAALDQAPVQVERIMDGEGRRVDLRGAPAGEAQLDGDLAMGSRTDRNRSAESGMTDFSTRRGRPAPVEPKAKRIWPSLLDRGGPGSGRNCALLADASPRRACRGEQTERNRRHVKVDSPNRAPAAMSASERWMVSRTPAWLRGRARGRAHRRSRRCAPPRRGPARAECGGQERGR